MPQILYVNARCEHNSMCSLCLLHFLGKDAVMLQLQILTQSTKLLPLFFSVSPSALGNSNWQDNLLTHTSQPSEHKISLDAKGLKTKI